MKKNILFSILFTLILACPVFAEIETDPEELYNKGIDFYEQNKLDQSIATFQKAVALKPDFYEAYYNLARVLESAGKNKEAFEAYEALIKLKPDDDESIYRYGSLLYKWGYLKKSVETLSKIGPESDLKEQTDKLIATIKVRQKEVAEETRVKSEQAKRANIIGTFPAPSGLVVDSKGYMFVASFSQNIIYKISPNGQEKTPFIDKTKGVSGPVGLTIDSFDNLYVANYTKDNIMLVDKNGNASVLMYAKKPYCLSLDEPTKKLYITEQANNSVISYDLSEIFNASKQKANETKKDKNSKEEKESKVFTMPVVDKNPIGTPSIVQYEFINTDPYSNILSPIMVPASHIVW